MPLEVAFDIAMTVRNGVRARSSRVGVEVLKGVGRTCERNWQKWL